MPEGELLTTAQVLEFLKIGRTKLWELVRTGAFPAFRIGHGRNGPLRYRSSDVVGWLEAQRVENPEALESAPQRRAGAGASDRSG